MVNILVKHASLPEELQDLLRNYDPRSRLGQLIKKALAYLPLGDAQELLDAVLSSVVIESQLGLVVIRNTLLAPSEWRREDLGVVGYKVVTNNGVAAIVDAFQNTVELETFKYHGIGTGTNAEAAADSALQTELTTEYTGNVRATGTTEEGASANIYKTIATNTLDSGTPAITEHGIFTQAATGGGTLLDRTKFSAINLDGTVGDALQSTYQLTFTAGS